MTTDSDLATAALLCLQAACQARGYKASIRLSVEWDGYVARATRVAAEVMLDVRICKHLFVFFLSEDMLWFVLAEMGVVRTNAGLQECIVNCVNERPALSINEPDFDFRTVDLATQLAADLTARANEVTQEHGRAKVHY